MPEEPLLQATMWRAVAVVVALIAQQAHADRHPLAIGAGTAALVKNFAPVFKFDTDAQFYPTTAEAYYTAGCTAKVCPMESFGAKVFDPSAHVYYATISCGDQVRIKYHFFYNWQPPCMTSPTTEGQHQSDWEDVTVILSADKQRVAAVKYGQHGGHYLRLAGRDGFETENGKPVVYVGQYAHGSFHDSKGKSVIGPQSCAYYGDSRGGGISWDAGITTLVDLLAPSNETWIAATQAAPGQEIKWEGGQGISFLVDQWQPKCDEVACTGTSYDLTAHLGIGMKDTGCSKSQCRTGWKDSGLLGCYTCPSGYIDCGAYCAQGTRAADCVNPFKKHAKEITQGYDYVIPTTDEGLL
eukprot:GHRR01001483.1.p1 GENE.GHRR01001483.1~~GHRR01001483.1.p1  ORF type:complete len:354 (+),score=99.46 GHRR01001483.1:873-1934(+)